MNFVILFFFNQMFCYIYTTVLFHFPFSKSSQSSNLNKISQPHILGTIQKREVDGIVHNLEYPLLGDLWTAAEVEYSQIRHTTSSQIIDGRVGDVVESQIEHLQAAKEFR